MKKKYPLFLSVVSGLLLSLPWLLMGFCWVLLFAFVPLFLAEYLLVKTKSNPVAFTFFCVAFPAFLIWNVCSTWWIAYVSLVGMLTIVLLNSILMTMVWSLRYMVKRRIEGVSVFFLLPIFWLAFEFLHYNWSAQWPWLNLGNGFSSSVKFIQWYEFTGVPGGSLWILLSNILGFFFIKNIRSTTFRYSVKLLAGLILCVGVPLSWSLYCYSSYQENGSTIEVLALQPNIDPYTQKFSAMSSEMQVEKVVQLAKSYISGSTDLIVAPETALPDMWEDSISIRNAKLKSLTGLFKLNPELRIIAGAITMKRYGNNEHLSETARHAVDGSYSYDIFNSALMFDSIGNIQIGHKSILVSGVEKMPFHKYISYFDRFLLQVGGTGGSLGMAKEPAIFNGKDSVKIGPIICFESAFGEYVGWSVLKGANLLVVLTNDGWWKASSGSYQHFSYSRLRAIETRRCIVCSANTGISGFINQRGDVSQKSRINKDEVLRASVYLNNEITFYTQYGDFLGRMATCFSVMILLYYIGSCCWKR